MNIHSESSSFPGQIQSSVVLGDDEINQAIEEVAREMGTLGAAHLRSAIKMDAVFANMIRRLMMNLTIVLAMTKTLEDDEDAAEVVGLLKDADFQRRSNLAADFSRAALRADLEQLDGSGDALLYQYLPPEVIRRRYLAIEAFIDRAVQ